MLAFGAFAPFAVLSRSHARWRLPGVGVGIDTRIAPYLAPVVAFVAAYSFLPHKELRFLLPAAPLLYLVLAHGMSKW